MNESGIVEFSQRQPGERPNHPLFFLNNLHSRRIQGLNENKARQTGPVYLSDLQDSIPPVSLLGDPEYPLEAADHAIGSVPLQAINSVLG